MKVGFCFGHCSHEDEAYDDSDVLRLATSRYPGKYEPYVHFDEVIRLLGDKDEVERLQNLLKEVLDKPV